MELYSNDSIPNKFVNNTHNDSEDNWIFILMISPIVIVISIAVCVNINVLIKKYLKCNTNNNKIIVESIDNPMFI